MCHSFTICSHQDLECALCELSGNASVALPEGVMAGGTAFPGAFAPVIVCREENPSQAEFGSFPAPATQTLFPLDVREYRFGWPVEWKKGTVFNARFESLLEGKGMWGDALMRRRCILPCESFFESHRTEMMASPHSGKPVKRRYTFMAETGASLLLAAVFEGGSFSVVTVPANDDVAPVHDRMPLALTRDEARAWLDPATPLPQIAAIAECGRPALRSTVDGTPINPLQPDQQMSLF